MIQHAHRGVLLYFIPITLLCTPLGNISSDRIQTSAVQAVGGLIVSMVALYEIYSKHRVVADYFCHARKREVGQESEDKKPIEEHQAASSSPSSIDVEINVTTKTDGLEGNHYYNCNATKTDNDNCSTDHELKLTPGNSTVAVGENQRMPREQVGENCTSSRSNIKQEEQNVHTKDEDKNLQPNCTDDTSSDSKKHPLELGVTNESSIVQNQPNIIYETLPLKAKLCTIVTGGLSGFLGGLCGIRGPPLIFYFLHPPHPLSFTKKAQRATGVAVMFCNVSMRIIYYLYDALAFKGSQNYFSSDDWQLYISVFVSSVLGGIVGAKLFGYIRDSQDVIRGMLSVLLLFSGCGLLLSAIRKS